MQMVILSLNIYEHELTRISLGSALLKLTYRTFNEI